jgi:hypothetical protein
MCVCVWHVCVCVCVADPLWQAEVGVPHEQSERRGSRPHRFLFHTHTHILRSTNIHRHTPHGTHTRTHATWHAHHMARTPTRTHTHTQEHTHMRTSRALSSRVLLVLTSHHTHGPYQFSLSLSLSLSFCVCLSLGSGVLPKGGARELVPAAPGNALAQQTGLVNCSCAHIYYSALSLSPSMSVCLSQAASCVPRGETGNSTPFSNTCLWTHTHCSFANIRVVGVSTA